MDELQDLVSNFIKTYEPSSEEKALEESPKQLEDHENENEKSEEVADLPDDIELVDKLSESDDEDPETVFNKFLEAGEDQKDSDTVKKIKATVGAPVVSEGNLFSSTKINFNIETAPFGWKVLRRYKDCLIYRQILKNHYPGSIIPPLDKKFIKDKNEPKWIADASSRMQRFLLELQRDPILSRSKFTCNFLGLDNRKKYEAKVKTYVKPISLKSALNADKLNTKSDITLEMKQQVNRLGSYPAKVKELYEKLKEVLIETDRAMMNVGELMKKDAGIFIELAKLHESIKSTELADLFNKLKIIYEFSGKIYRKQALLFNEKVNKFINYYIEEVDSITEVNSIVDDVRKAFNTKEEDVNEEKEHLFSEGKTLTWNLPKEIFEKVPITELINNKEVAFSYMLPDVSFCAS